MDKKTILANCDASSGWDGVSFNISAKRLYRLLEDTSRRRGDLGRSAKELLAAMEADRWRVNAGIHAGGFSEGGRMADPRSHITLRTYHTNKTHHLRFHSFGHELIEIT